MIEETRKSGTLIEASEAIGGFWYVVGSGEIERCVGSRPRGKGVQVGFAGIIDSGRDPEEIRWLPGKSPIHVASEVEDAARLLRGFCDDAKGPRPDLDFEQCPRNGLVCVECGYPQRATPGGDTCANGHGGAKGEPSCLFPFGAGARCLSVHEVLEGASEPCVVCAPHVEKARADQKALFGAKATPGQLRVAALDAVGAIQANAQANGTANLADSEIDDEIDAARAARPSKSAEEIFAAYPELHGAYERAMAGTPLIIPASDLESLAARTADLTVKPTPAYHKSLHIDWRTPQALFDSQARRWGGFWLDAAATKDNKLCEFWLGPGSDVEDALSIDWEANEEVKAQYGKSIWLNHPYSKGEEICGPECTRKKCAERGYHCEKAIASSGTWLAYARGQALKGFGPIVCLSPARIETQWWKDAIRSQPSGAGNFVNGHCDPRGGPAAKFMDAKYPAATWLEFAWENLIVDIVEIEGRVDFERGGNDGSAGFPSAIVTFYKPGQAR